MFEIQITSGSILELPFVTMGLMGLSIVLLIKYLLAAIRRQCALKTWGEQLCRQLVTLLISLQVLLWQLCYYSASHDKVAIWCVGIAAACGIVFWHVTQVPLKSLLPTSRTMQLMLGIVSLLQVAGFVHTTKRLMDPVNTLIFGNPAPGKLVPRSEYYATTDQGQRISLFARNLSEELFRRHVLASSAALAKLSDQSIKSSEPEASTNCHGWVFAAGKYILRGAEVQQILDDNGYREVAVPLANDVIIYRDEAGAVMHTGLVRSAVETGQVLIESKWGFASTYIHFASKQPYSQRFAYYRSARSGHTIHIASTQMESPTPANFANLNRPPAAIVEFN